MALEDVGCLMDVRVGPDVITLHLDDHILVCDLDGQMSRDAGHGFFAADTRFVSGYRIRLGGRTPELLASAAVSAFGARFEFTNSPLRSSTGDIEAGSLHLRVERALGGGLHEDYDIVNYGRTTIDLTLEVSVECDFADIFEVKDHTVVRRGTLQSNWAENECRLTTNYHHDDFDRSIDITAERSQSTPEFANGGISFRIELAPAQRWHTCLVWQPSSRDLDLASPRRSCHTLSDGAHSTDEARRSWLAGAARFSTTAAGPNDAAGRAVDDLAGLRLHQHDALATGADPNDGVDDGRWVPAAGVPWFTALFGRDSLVVALQTMALSPMFPIGTLSALGALQGDDYDDARDMQPGKILHELRRGELAHFRLIPHTPYYGSHDSTALYVWTAAQAWRWHGSRALLDAVRPNVERALAWIDTDGDIDGDGLQEYSSRALNGGYYNQGWKDSGDGIVTEKGRIAELPLALCELQGYVVAAKRTWADVVEEVWKEPKTAARLRSQADRLAGLVEERFWWEEEGTYYLGLDGHKQPIRSVASNAGHLLWTHAVDPERALMTAHRLLAPDMWSGWGVRTLSADHVSYNPFSYHRGSVWPHDNAIVAAGMRTYGLHSEAAQVAGGIFSAAERFKDRRLPELFAGLPRDQNGFPVPYLGANVPQAWASGAIVHLLTTLLGLAPDAHSNRLDITAVLPDWLPDLRVENIEIGTAALNILVSRNPDGSSVVDYDHVRGNLEVRLGGNTSDANPCNVSSKLSDRGRST